jgi:hypothetical protein
MSVVIGLFLAGCVLTSDRAMHLGVQNRALRAHIRRQNETIAVLDRLRIQHEEGRAAVVQAEAIIYGRG